MADLFLNLGIDFGTSFTKVVVCDTSRENSWIINFSSNKITLNEALLPSKIGISHKGMIYGGLTHSEWEKVNSDISIYIDFIKMRLANLDLQEEGLGHPSDKLPFFDGIDLNEPVVIECMCAYYLSKVINKSKSWILKNNQQLVKNQEIEWSANIGVPVKYFDSKAIDRFQKVLKLAWLLDLLHLEQESLLDLLEKCDILDKQNNEHNLPCEAIPEIAAAIYSYTMSRQVQEKPTVFFDIGSGTIEGSAFLFKRDAGLPIVEFYSGEVEPLGVEAISKRCAISLNNQKLQSQIIDELVFNSDDLLQLIYEVSLKIARPAVVGDKIANKIFVKETHSRVLVQEVKKQLSITKDVDLEKLLLLIICQSLIHSLVAKTVSVIKDKLPAYLRELLVNKESLLVFLGGGGSQSSFFVDTIKYTHTAFMQNCYIPLPEYELRNVPFPSSFDMGDIPSSDFHRFLIAYGLSTNNVPEINGFPKQFPFIEPPKRNDYHPPMGKYSNEHDSM